jgi:hypothetical protein
MMTRGQTRSAAEQKRRREIIDAAIVGRVAVRLADVPSAITAAVAVTAAASSGSRRRLAAKATKSKAAAPTVAPATKNTSARLSSRVQSAESRNGVRCRKTNGMDAWLLEHAVEHKLRFEEAAYDGRDRRWTIDCDTCGSQLNGCSLANVQQHVKTAKHIHCLTAGVLRRQPSVVDVWIAEHAAAHKLRVEELPKVVGRTRSWAVDCDACGQKSMTMTSVAGLERHVRSGRHLRGRASDDDTTVHSRFASSFDAWLKQHAAAQRMRFDVTMHRGKRHWNIDCDACGRKWVKQRHLPFLEKHVNSAQHVANIMSYGEDPATRKMAQRQHGVDAWLQEHAAAHRMRFEEKRVVKGTRNWSIDCDACGTKIALVHCADQLRCHVNSAKHINGLSADEDPATRLVLSHTNKVADWLKAHAAKHNMRFEVVYVNRSSKWNVTCGCGARLRHVHACTLSKHVKSAKHVNAASAAAESITNAAAQLAVHPPALQRKRARS